MLQICSNQHGDDGHHQELRGIWPGSLCRFERKSLGAIFRPRIPLGEGAVCFSFVISLNSDKSLTHAFHSNRFFFALICKILLIFRSCHLCFSFSCKYSFWFLLHCDRYKHTISWKFQTLVEVPSDASLAAFFGLCLHQRTQLRQEAKCMTATLAAVSSSTEKHPAKRR